MIDTNCMNKLNDLYSHYNATKNALVNIQRHNPRDVSTIASYQRSVTDLYNQIVAQSKVCANHVIDKLNETTLTEKPKPKPKPKPLEYPCVDGMKYNPTKGIYEPCGIIF